MHGDEIKCKVRNNAYHMYTGSLEAIGEPSLGASRVGTNETAEKNRMCHGHIEANTGEINGCCYNGRKGD
jgi:hypothetical protein